MESHPVWQTAFATRSRQSTYPSTAAKTLSLIGHTGASLHILTRVLGPYHFLSLLNSRKITPERLSLYATFHITTSSRTARTFAHHLRPRPAPR
jgi:hypothetical protein